MEDEYDYGMNGNQDISNQEKEDQFYHGQNNDNEKQKSESKTLTLNTYQKKTTSALITSEFAIDIELIRKNGFPYPDLDEIPVIEFKNEDYFKSGEVIQNYLRNIKNINIDSFDDRKFTRCRNCNNNNNYNYCIRCERNLCINCSANNKECNHELINLQNLANSANNAIIDITNIIEKVFIKQKRENPKEKLQKIYDEKELDSGIHQDKNEISESIENYEKQDDIKLIHRIIGVNYYNYFHFNNILKCKNYLEYRYNRCFNKRCLIINYNSELFEINEEIQIFGDDFVENNRDKLFLIINNEPSQLESRKRIRDEYLEIILVQISDNAIRDLSYMFQNCTCLKDFEIFKDHEQIYFKNVENISFMFNGCREIETLDLELFGSFENVTNMDSVFFECNNLTEIKGIELWYTNKVETMSSMFNSCQHLEEINGIENFDTQNVTDFSEMFYDCQKLMKIPQIKNWEMGKAENLKGMFKYCLSLEELPDISGWETKNVTTMEAMFYGCSSIIAFPDFSRWNMNKIKNINEMFRDCTSLLKRPDISNWHLKSSVKKSYIFAGCPNN